jgi:hypothetical protein
MVTAPVGPARDPSVEAPKAARCGFCHAEFVEDPGQAACQACPLGRGCGLIRCPHCGYENPRQPAWLEKLRRWVP